MGLCEVLTVLFIALKLLGVINWSWWLVASPMFISLALYVVVFIVIAVSGAFPLSQYKRQGTKHE